MEALKPRLQPLSASPQSTRPSLLKSTVPHFHCLALLCSPSLQTFLCCSTPTPSSWLDYYHYVGIPKREGRVFAFQEDEKPKCSVRSSLFWVHAIISLISEHILAPFDSHTSWCRCSSALYINVMFLTAAELPSALPSESNQLKCK